MLVLRSSPNTGLGIWSLWESESALNEDKDELWSVDPNVIGQMKSGFVDSMWNLVSKVRATESFC